MNNFHKKSHGPLVVEEVIELLRSRWGATYELRILIRNNKIFLQMMWGYLEQQSYEISKNEFNMQLNNTLEVINRLGEADFVRFWLMTCNAKPRLGKALNLQLKADDRLKEFLI